MLRRLLHRGSYTGRLAFDPDSGFHIDAGGRRVVTDDSGLTWRYARRHDPSHNARYGRSIVGVDSTANLFAQLAVEQGTGVATATVQASQPHHFDVHFEDGHHDPDAPNKTRLVVHPDVDAPTQTSHTDSWKQT